MSWEMGISVRSMSHIIKSDLSMGESRRMTGQRLTTFLIKIRVDRWKVLLGQKNKWSSSKDFV
ncbi:unnamed protein product [Nezara viridula]|uniref:Uncharacterized protein n=1 Tax=Nezara viridula TaxID=85310 RepID=A0A9P0H8C8_NEZVI|nr:unnamed protein product [Nezara viridula]